MRRRLALAALSGALTFAAFPGIGAWPLAFVAWAPLLLALEGVTLRRAAALGFVAGLVAALPGFRFLYPTLRAESGFGPAVCVLLVVAVAAYHALRGLLLGLIARADAPRASVRRTHAPGTVTPADAPRPAAAPATSDASPSPGPPSFLFVAGLAASEIAIPSLFPWFFGASVHDVPMFLQVAEIGGPVAVSVVLAFGSLAVAETASSLRDDRPTRPRVIVPALAIPIVAAFWGSLRIPEIDARARTSPSITTGVVQPNLARGDELTAVQRLRDASHDLVAKGAQLVVWPEGAVPWTLPAPYIEDAFAMIRAPAVPILAGALVQGDTPPTSPAVAPAPPSAPASGGPAAAPSAPASGGPAAAPSAPASGAPEPGAAGLDTSTSVAAASAAATSAAPGSTVSATAVPGAPAGPARVSNSALLFDAGRLVGRYDKHHLLPFSETLPLERHFPWLRDLSPHSGSFAPGTSLSPLHLRGHAMAVFICYEDLFPGHVRALSSRGDVELLVNLTNDGWFQGTDEPRVHLALAKLRAVEQRKYLVRATLTGKSAIIDPAGREIGTLGDGREGTLLADVRFVAGSTLYNRTGDLPWWLLVASAIAYALWRRHSPPAALAPSVPA